MRRIDLVAPRGTILRAQVPETRRERMRGLLGRPSLGRDQALLLEATRSVHTFGMGFPIRVALLDHDLVIRRIQHVPRNRLLLPRRGVRHVLEYAGGADLRPGDWLRIAGPTEGARQTAAILPGAAPGPGAGCGMTEPPSSSGLGFRPFKAATRVRIPLGAHNRIAHAPVEESGRPHRPVKAEIAGSKPVGRAT